MENKEKMENYAELATSVKYIEKTIDEIKDEFKMWKQEYVLKSEFNSYKQEVSDKLAPLTKIVYGAVSIILIEVLTAILFLVIKK